MSNSTAPATTDTFVNFSYTRDIQQRPVDYILGAGLFGFLAWRYRGDTARFYRRGLPILMAGCFMLHTLPMIRRYGHMELQELKGERPAPVRLGLQAAQQAK